jgi:hypothetical protein
MANLEKLNFPALSLDGANYLAWSLDVRANLIAKSMLHAIVTVPLAPGESAPPDPTPAEEAGVLVYIRRHLHPYLQIQSLHLVNPRELWENLQARFDHQKLMALPKARQDWMNLRVQDFTTVAAYNNELFRISSTLTLCGEPVSDSDLMEKTLSTFHPSNIVLSTQYRNMRFRQYSELISHLLVAEKQQEIILRNAKQRPPGTLPTGHLLENHVILDPGQSHARGSKGNPRDKRSGKPSNRGSFFASRPQRGFQRPFRQPFKRKN